MTRTPPPAQITETSLMLWFMHRLSEEFEVQAILKGGMELALLNSPRKTGDLDYVFAPYTSKKQIEPKLKGIAEEIPGVRIGTSQSSKNLQMDIRVEDVSIQIEASVAKACKSLVMTTTSLATKLNTLARPIRVMSLDVAFAHKLAAWNERRLLRDLYDCYFLFEVQKEKPDLDVLKARLARIESRIPKLKKIKKMSIPSFLEILEKALSELNQGDFEEELTGLLNADDLFGLEKRLKTTLHRLLSAIRHEISQGD